MVGNQDHDHVGSRRNFGYVGHCQSLGCGRFTAAAAGIQTHHYILSVIAKVEGVSVALAAIADDANGLSFQQPQICVLVVVNVYHCCLVPSLY